MNKLKCESVEVPNDFQPKEWCEEQGSKFQLRFLLAHAEDGVIWGKFHNGSLITADTVFSQFPKLRQLTLQQCRIFGEKSEVMLWRTDEGFKARLINDEHIDKKEYIPENQILWGTHVKEVRQEGFTLLRHGKQGLEHAVPLINIEEEKERKLKNSVRLRVHHYIDYDDDSGVAYIYLSRLVDLYAKEIKA